MNTRVQALFLVLLVLVSVAFTKIKKDLTNEENALNKKSAQIANSVGIIKSNTSDQSMVQSGESENLDKIPKRRWEVLDPALSAQAISVQSLGQKFSFLNLHTRTEKPLASLAKLLSALVVIEDIGINKKIPITENAIETKGASGGLRSGEVYSAEDLLKIMLLTSSNDAASSFEDYAGGRSEFVRLMNKKASSIGMINSVFHDAAGLNDLTVGTAYDVLVLMKYIAEKHPEIFTWTRLVSVIVQPLNDASSRTISNINPFIQHKNFIGGKTGTLDSIGENFAGIFSFKDFRIMVVVLGSENRVRDVDEALSWVEKAYIFE